MFSWQAYPLIRIVLWYILGIVLSAYVPLQNGTYIGFTLIVWLAFITLVIFARKERFREYSILIGFVAMLLALLSGYTRLELHKLSNNPDHFMHQSSFDYYEALVLSAAQEKPNSYKVELQLLNIRQEGKWKKSAGKVLSYFAKDSTLQVPSYGDYLLVKGMPARLQDPGNPNEFDYKRFLGYNNIYHQHYLRPVDFQWIRHDAPNPIYAFSLKIRNYCLDVLEQHLHGKQELAIAAALTIGMKDELDMETISAYSASGAMHVLAVSGLHVGIIFLILSKLFGKLNSSQLGRLHFAIITISLLWLYACVTGLSASVLRAVTMFTLIIIAQASNRKSNIYNTLAASALLLLNYDPYLIMSVGFQLSYLAVIGIVYLQPKLYRLWYTRSKVLDWVWSITCVSVSAQLATFALGLLYFHQFPTYFMFSNLLIIPAAFGILCNGLLLLSLSWVPYLGSVLGVCLEWMIRATNLFVFWVESLPFSLVKDIYLETYQSWMLYAMALCVILLFYTRRIGWLYFGVLFTALFTWSRVQFWYQNAQQKYVVVHKVNNQTVIDWVDGNSHFLKASTEFLSNQEAFRFHVKPHLLQSGMQFLSDQPPGHKRLANFDLYVFNQKSFLIIDQAVQHPPWSEKLKVNYLIISKNAIRTLDDLEKWFEFDQLIIDSSNKAQYAQQLLNQANEKNIACYSVPHQGYLRLELK